MRAVQMYVARFYPWLGFRLGVTGDVSSVCSMPRMGEEQESVSLTGGCRLRTLSRRAPARFA
jgi:hypothetical protein